MFYRIILFIFLISFISCKTLQYDNQTGSSNYYTLAQNLLKQGKFFDLKKASDKILEKDPKNYRAAYYKAFCLQKMNANGVHYYINYINQYPDTPNWFKSKWIDLALTNPKKIKKIDLNRIKIAEVDFFFDKKNKKSTQSIIKQDENNYFYLNHSGSLYLIDKKENDSKKINYSRTNDFILINSYLIFNDSVNLIKYDINNKEHAIIKSFETDNISLIKFNSFTNEGIINLNLKSHVSYLYVNFNDLNIRKLPDNSIDHSSDLTQFAINSNNHFEIYNLYGEKLHETNHQFLIFTPDNHFISRLNGYIYYHDRHENSIRKLIYIPVHIPIKKTFSIAGKLIINFENYILVSSIDGNQMSLVKGTLHQLFATGLTLVQNERLYYIDFNHLDLYLFNTLSDQELIKSCAKESIIARSEQDKLTIYDLKKIR